MVKKRIVTVDSSFWVHAVMLGTHQDLLDEFDLTLTTAVADELGVKLHSPSSRSGQILKAALEDRRARILDPFGPLINEFHLGEKTVLSLALEQPGEIIPLIDEAKAYQWAVKKKLPVMSTPLWLATRAIHLNEDPMLSLSKIKALVQGGHISMLVAHEAVIIITTLTKGGS